MDFLRRLIYRVWQRLPLNSIGERISKIATDLQEIDPDLLPDLNSVSDIKAVVDSAMNHTSLDISLVPFDNPFTSLSLTRDQDWVRDKSRFAWVRVKKQQWMLSIDKHQNVSLQKEGMNFIILEPDPKGTVYLVYLKTMIHKFKTQFSKSELLFQHDTLESAFDAADTFIRRKIGFHRANALTRYAPWRQQPPTPNQRKLLHKWNLWRDYISRGEAAELLMKRMHGSLSSSRK